MTDKKISLWLLFINILLVGYIILKGTTFRDYDCVDFDNYSEAVKVFNRFTHDKYGLDNNGNGIPCEVSFPKEVR